MDIRLIVYILYHQQKQLHSQSSSASNVYIIISLKDNIKVYAKCDLLVLYKHLSDLKGDIANSKFDYSNIAVTLTTKERICYAYTLTM